MQRRTVRRVRLDCCKERFGELPCLMRQVWMDEPFRHQAMAGAEQTIGHRVVGFEASHDLATLWLRTVALAATITEIWKETLYNADTCTLRFASLADCNSAPEAQRNPTTPIKKSPAQQLEEPQEQHAGTRMLSSSF